jgi:hypothetical protein
LALLPQRLRFLFEVFELPSGVDVRHAIQEVQHIGDVRLG